jgi:predicted outer membrane repeat protein
MRQRRALLTILLSLLLCASSLQFARALGTTLTVCPSNCAFTTIAAALKAAVDGDTIVIEEGTYAGSVDVSKDVRIFGRGRDKTTIQGTSAASVIRIRRGANVQITALTITGGGGSPVGSDLAGGGILNEGKLALLDATVRDNTAAGGESRGGGLYSDSSKDVNIFRTVFSGNQAARGGGIYVQEGDVFISGSTIAGNVAAKQGGGIRHDGGETLRLVEQSVVRDNRAVIGGGVSVRSALQISDSTVSGNRAQFWAGVQGGAKLLQISQSTISGNIAETRGGGIAVDEGGAELLASTVEKNQSPIGAGIFTSGGDVSLLAGSTVSANVAAADGGGIFNHGAELDLANSKVIDNRAGNRGGGIFVESGGSVRLRKGGVVVGNQPDQCYPADVKC